MTQIKDGGPAFPVWELNGHGQPEMTSFGMTLRDYFAIRAFQTRLAKHNDWTLTEISDQAWSDADAMLRRRGAT